MKYRRICIENWLTLRRGREYTTSPVKFGTCMVYLKGKEIKAPSIIFAGAERIDEIS